MAIKQKLIGVLFAVLLLSSVSSQAFAAELGHVFAEQTSVQTKNAGAFSDISGAVISNTDLTAGKKYLIVVNLQFTHTGGTASSGFRTIHGSTVFEGSELDQEMSTIAYQQYSWFTVWTAVSGEDVKIQFDASASTLTADQITMVAIKLSDDLTENTDWFFAEDTTDTTIQSAWADDTSTASVTFTPNGTDDWLVLATAQLNPDAINAQFETRINASGGVTDTGVMWSQEGENSTTDINVQTLVKVYTPTNTSTTFETETQRETADGGTKLYNAIFALNLNKLRNHAFQATQAETSLDTTNAFATSTNVATVSVTPDIAGDVWVLGSAIYDSGNTAEAIKIRMQVDDTDQPDTQTSDNKGQLITNDATDEFPWIIQSIENLSSASHTLDVDATKATTVRPVEDRLAMMVTMELPAAGGGDCPSCNTDIQQNTGWIFALGGILTSWFNSFANLFTITNQAEAQIQEPISLRLKVVPQFTSTRSETQIRNFFNNQVIPKLETFVNNRLQSEFTNAQVSIALNLAKTGNNYEVYPKIVISGVPQSAVDDILLKYDMAVDDMTTSMLTDLNNAGISNVRFHIHKSFGSIDT